MYRGAKIVLPDGVSPLPVPIWQGDYYWWGGKEDLANAMMTTVAPVAIPAGGATLSFDLAYDIEDGVGLPVGPGLGRRHDLEYPDQRQHLVRA